ncbi:hypothetical protein ACFSTC_16300 [Nonomuraea ferruginea]
MMARMSMEEGAAMAFDAWSLIGDLEVALDVDVLVGAYPDRDGPPGGAESVGGLLAEHRTAAGAVASLRAALFDMRSGNDEVLALGGDPRWLPVGTVDLRDPVGAGRELDRLAGAGGAGGAVVPGRAGRGGVVPVGPACRPAGRGTRAGGADRRGRAPLLAAVRGARRPGRLPRHALLPSGRLPGGGAGGAGVPHLDPAAQLPRRAGDGGRRGGRGAAAARHPRAALRADRAAAPAGDERAGS